MRTKTKAKKVLKKSKGRPAPRVMCAKCNNPFVGSQMTRVTYPSGAVKRVCKGCAGDLDDETEEHGDETEGMGWYVLQVEPGREAAIKREVTKRAKIMDIKHKVGRIFCPARIEDTLVTPSGTVAAEGEAEDVRAAELAGHERACELAEVTYLGQKFVPGYYVRCYPTKGKEKGKEGNRWKWVVRKRPDNPEPVRSVKRVSKYPGYLICNLLYDKEVESILHKLRDRGCWGLLLRPVALGYKAQVTKGVRTFNWKVRHPNSNAIVSKGKEADEGRAWERARSEKARLEEFRPTQLESAEAAELLLRQKAVNQICKDREVKYKAMFDYRVGETVRVVSGPFRGAVGEVVRVGKDDVTDPEVIIKTPILGHPIEVQIKFFEAEKETK